MRAQPSDARLHSLQVTAATQDAADREMAKLLAEAYDDVLETLQRNREALDVTVSTLLEQTTMSGQQVRTTCLTVGSRLHE
jgi:ATP-dependent Zn protease